MIQTDSTDRKQLVGELQTDEPLFFCLSKYSSLMHDAAILECTPLWSQFMQWPHCVHGQIYGKDDTVGFSQ